MNAQISTATAAAPAPAPLMMECPICFDDINPSKNCIITECNHTFHSSCMLKSIVHGNFDCPCCRFELAEMPEDEEDDEDYDEEEDYDEDEDHELYVGFRALFVRAEGNEYDEDDEYDDEEVNIPLNCFVNKLKNLNYTYEDLVKLIADEACFKVDLEERTSDLIEVFQDIVNSYKPGDEVPELNPEVKPVVTGSRFRATIDLCGNN